MAQHCRHAWISRASHCRATRRERPPRHRGATALRSWRNLGRHRGECWTYARARTADREGIWRRHALGLQMRRRHLRNGATNAEPLLPASSAPIRAIRRPARHQAAPHGSAWDHGELQGRALSLRPLPNAERRESARVQASPGPGDAAIRTSWVILKSTDRPGATEELSSW